MRVKDVITLVDSYEPNAYDKNTKARWVRECEGKVYTQLFLQQPIGFPWGSPADYLEEELAIPAPFNQIYAQYLRAMIHYANAEPDRYNMDMSLFNQTWHELCVWFGQDYDVSDRARNRSVTVRFGGKTDEAEDSYTQVLLKVPERCAFVAGRIVVKRPFIGDPEDPQAVTGQAWYRDPESEITGTIKFYQLGSTPLKMLIGDVGGTDVGVNIDAMDGEAYLTGVLCIPEEIFFRWPQIRGDAPPPVVFPNDPDILLR